MAKEDQETLFIILGHWFMSEALAFSFKGLLQK